MGTKITGPRVDVRAGTKTDAGCVALGQAVGQLAVTTPEYGSDPAFKGTIDTVVAAGTALGAAAAGVDTAIVELGGARGNRNITRYAFDKTYGVAVAQVEKYAQTPADLVAAGFLVLNEASPTLVVPSSIQVVCDPRTGVIVAHVLYPRGVRAQCVIAISPDPIGAATYVELPGHGRVQRVAGYAPGTYWVRACTVRATARSAWVGPIAVIVK